MKPKYSILGGIALTTSAIGMAGAGTAIWCVMNRQPPRYLLPHTDTRGLPQNVTPILPPANFSPKKKTFRPVESNSENLNAQEVVALKPEQNAPDYEAGFPRDCLLQSTSAHIRNVSLRSVIVNSQSISDRDLAALDIQNGSTVPNGHYWYDSISGAWGLKEALAKVSSPLGWVWVAHCAPIAPTATLGFL